jgi:hypothetical protein
MGIGAFVIVVLLANFPKCVSAQDNSQTGQGAEYCLGRYPESAGTCGLGRLKFAGLQIGRYLVGDAATRDALLLRFLKCRDRNSGMVDFWGTTFTIALGGIGWLVTSFFGRPYMQFHDLRSDVIQKSVLYDNVRAAATQRESDGYRSHVELTEVELDRLREAQAEFRGLAARMRAFALNEPLTVWFVKLWHYDPLEASAVLLGVSNTLDAYGPDRNDAKKKLEQVLRFRTIV